MKDSEAVQEVSSVFGDPPSGLPRFDKGVNVSISGGGGRVGGGGRGEFEWPTLC